MAGIMASGAQSEFDQRESKIADIAERGDKYICANDRHRAFERFGDDKAQYGGTNHHGQDENEHPGRFLSLYVRRAHDIEHEGGNENVVGDFGERALVQMQTVSGQVADDHQRKNRRDDIDEDFDDLEGHVAVRDENQQ